MPQKMSSYKRNSYYYVFTKVAYPRIVCIIQPKNNNPRMTAVTRKDFSLHALQLIWRKPTKKHSFLLPFSDVRSILKYGAAYLRYFFCYFQILERSYPVVLVLNVWQKVVVVYTSRSWHGLVICSLISPSNQGPVMVVRTN